MKQNSRLIKLALAAFVVAGVAGSSFGTRAYPPFFRKAVKFGAKDCTFCHLQKEGGEGWNERGQWLMAEKEKRKADVIDVEWLQEYKEAEKGAGDGKQAEKEPGSEAGKEPGKEPGKEKDQKKPKDPSGR